jgi:hypothetical protein
MAPTASCSARATGRAAIVKAGWTEIRAAFAGNGRLFAKAVSVILRNAVVAAFARMRVLAVPPHSGECGYSGILSSYLGALILVASLAG